MRHGFAETLRSRLDELNRGLPARRWLVAFSGGVDSTVMLHVLAGIVDANDILAVHVDHGLHENSANWEQHCRAFAATLGVNFRSERVKIDRQSGLGIEGAARIARYALFESQLLSGEVLLTAHHRDDQAETLLLNLLRGSGTTGLAGIGDQQPLGAGRLLRPLLKTGRQEILHYAAEHDLPWLEDPSNEETELDRNFLRHEVLPLLGSRWPSAAEKLARSAELMADANVLAADLAQMDLATCGTPERLALNPLRKLSPPRQANLFRFAVRQCRLPPAPAMCIVRVFEELLDARADAQPMVAWPGAECRRYRDDLFLLRPLGAAPARPAARLRIGGEALRLGSGIGRLSLVPVAEAGIVPGIAEAGLEIRFRRGGEMLRTAPAGATRTLKNLLQEHGVLPWMRERVPLLFSGDRLVAVADMWVAAECTAVPGFAVRWSDKPAIR